MENIMNTRQLGINGPYITEIGLGTWAIGGPWSWGWGSQDAQQSIETIRRAFELGINWIDTAPVYGLGHSETVVGKAIKGYRKQIFLATKCGLAWDDRRRVTNNNRPESIKKECENSLGRLNVDHIDLYQIHWPDSKTSVEESWGAMIQLKEEGKVRYIGVSNFDVTLLQKCHEIEPVQSLQPPYSVLHKILYPEVENEILPWCKEHKVGIVAYGPLQAGLLTGSFDKKRMEQLPQDDWRHKSEFFKEPMFSKSLQFIKQIKPISDKYNKSLTELAIAWVLMNFSITSAIVGARQAKQVDKNVGGANWTLAQEDMDTISKISSSIFG
jgi:aryl-alcohol dehydrogenase-like predicted oxidoreductase